MVDKTSNRGDPELAEQQDADWPSPFIAARTPTSTSHGALGTWVGRHALAIAGPVHETYLAGPLDTADEDAWRTEIGWPIRPASSRSDTTVDEEFGGRPSTRTNRAP